jgi:hypothetical protein
MAGKYRPEFYIINKYLLSWLPDALFHNVMGFVMNRRYKAGRYYWMNIASPGTYCEKLQWLKSHGDIALKSRLADKFDVRAFVAKRIGAEHIVKLLPLNVTGTECVTEVNDIDFEVLPSSFVLKMTKGSGYNIVCRDKSTFDVDEARRRLRTWLRVDNYCFSREPQYKGQNKIICEELLEWDISDYKFFCFDGVPKILKVDSNRMTEHHANYFDMDWTPIDLEECGLRPNRDKVFKKPVQFDEMKQIAAELSKGWPIVRVDMYVHAGMVYFGELTFHPTGGYSPMMPRRWEKIIGDWINLNKE